MGTKSHMSLKTKKILAGVGIAFGTILVFLISFVLAFSLIVNPIKFMTVSDNETIKENEKLKKEVQTLNDEIDHLNASVDKYQASASAPAVVVTPEPTPAQSETTESQKPADDTTANSSNGTSASSNGTTTTGGSNQNSDFAPETVTGTDQKTPEDVEEPITVIDISE